VLKDCLRNSLAVTAIQATRSGVRVPLESSKCCTSYTLFPLPSYSSRWYFMLVGFVYPRLLPLLFRQLLVHLYPYCLYFSLLLFMRVPVVTKSPITFIMSICLSVRPQRGSHRTDFCGSLYCLCLLQIRREHSNLFRIG
jgi:hypothetical protein